MTWSDIIICFRNNSYALTKSVIKCIHYAPLSSVIIGVVVKLFFNYTWYVDHMCSSLQ